MSKCPIIHHYIGHLVLQCLIFHYSRIIFSMETIKILGQFLCPFTSIYIIHYKQCLKNPQNPTIQITTDLYSFKSWVVAGQDKDNKLGAKLCQAHDKLSYLLIKCLTCLKLLKQIQLLKSFTWNTRFHFSRFKLLLQSFKLF